MTLWEMSAAYRDSAELLRTRLALLRAARRASASEEEARALERRIRDLTPLLRQCRELASLTEHYYEGSCRRYERYRL